MRDNLTPTTQESVDGYESTSQIFASLFREIKELAKKKPDASMSAFKVRQINRLLADIRSFLKEAPERKYLDLLDDNELPQIADALVVMAQYEGALKGFHERHFGWDGLTHDWCIKPSRGKKEK